MSTRIYKVKHGETTKLVRATTPTVARSYVAKDLITVEVASQDDIVNIIGAGGKVEETTAGPVQTQMGE